MLFEFRSLLKHNCFIIKLCFLRNFHLLYCIPLSMHAFFPSCFPFFNFFLSLSLPFAIQHEHPSHLLNQTYKNLVIVHNILACFKHHISKASTFINSQKIQRLPINNEPQFKILSFVIIIFATRCD